MFFGEEMVREEYVISGLRKQCEMLAGLISQLETKPQLNSDDLRHYEETLRYVEKNLHILRKSKHEFSSKTDQLHKLH